VTTFNDLVRNIRSQLPQEYSGHVDNTCSYVQDKLGEEHADLDAPIPADDLQEATAEVYALFERALHHKRYEHSHAPSGTPLASFCDALEATLASRQPARA